ncbi:MAG: 2-octaprenyl-3-methyl-6-methoxy-1,4-benzoquinol hydroxylase [Gammaproteobacteria bacterium]|nr:MAG: 2-octaprenyl-3-methyl-6-methoxy-1,4-benzoquinol hydroxylase [Gammaproteobacteria bacterium]
MSSSTDIIGGGGGMGGAAAACALGQQGFRVLLLEQKEPDCSWPREGYDIRVSAISRASRNIFLHLRAWEAMQARRVTPYERMVVWESGGAEIRFDAAELGEPELGHIIENSVIQCALWERMAQESRVKVRTGVTIISLHLDEENPGLTLEGGETLEAELIVAADGARSTLRELAGIPVSGWGYDQSALVCTVKAEKGNQATAWQRFMPDGPLALLPLKTERFSIVWSTSPQEASHLVGLPEEAFDEAITRASEARLGQLTLEGERGIYPLRLQHANRYIKPGLALIGDAAHVIHPLAGQGVNLGLLDMAELVDVLVQARNRQRPLGMELTLRKYERARKGENLAMQGAMDLIKRLFSNDIPPVKLARNLGLELADRITPVKNLLVRNAMGTQGTLPSLAQPPTG